jgi:hypothetical protein
LITETIFEFGWTVLPHLLLISNLAPSDFNPFVLMKDGLHGKYFGNDIYGIVAQEGDAGFGSWWRRYVQSGGEYVEK